MPRDITSDSENFIHMVVNKSYSCLEWKVRFYNWTLVITMPTIRITISLMVPPINKFTQVYLHTYFREEYDYHVWVRYSRCANVTHQSRPTLRSFRTFWKRSGLTCLKAQLMQQYNRSAKDSRHAKKQLVNISIMLSELMLLASTCHVSVQ